MDRCPTAASSWMWHVLPNQLQRELHLSSGASRIHSTERRAANGSPCIALSGQEPRVEHIVELRTDLKRPWAGTKRSLFGKNSIFEQRPVEINKTVHPHDVTSARTIVAEQWLRETKRV